MKTTKYAILAGIAAIATAAHADQFSITITNTGPQPLSPLFYAASNDQFNIFTPGAAASSGIKKVAEMGNASDLLAFASAAGASVAGYGLIGSSPLAPGATRTATFTADRNHPYFSFAAMLGKTNDGFIGESVNSLGYQLYDASFKRRLRIEVMGNRAWDAGTELNTQASTDLAFKGGQSNPQEPFGQAFIRVHTGVSAGIGDSWADMPNWSGSTRLAMIEIVPVNGSFGETRP